MDKQLSASQKSLFLSINFLSQLTDMCVRNIKRIVVIFRGWDFQWVFGMFEIVSMPQLFHQPLAKTFKTLQKNPFLASFNTFQKFHPINYKY